MPVSPPSRPPQPPMPETVAPVTALQALENALREALGDALRDLAVRLGGGTIEIDPARNAEGALGLRGDPRLRFDAMVDLRGLGYAPCRDGGSAGPRFAGAPHWQ